MIGLKKEASGLWIVTINRPEKANSLTLDMLNDLVTIANSAQDARALILTGTGQVFSAGADLDEARAGLATNTVWERLSGAIAALPGLSIAALNGTMAGGAMGMALACDIRLAVPGAKFFYPVMKLGFLPQPSDPGRMASLIGPARTKMIMMGGQKLLSDEALATGLVDRLAEPKKLIDVARDLAADTLAADPVIALGIKRICE
ncbi:enoyl-CoA hydratase/isomerase family protein [Pseudopelagicola sp. nBUS_19]|uniref:enoyl-CoA hydratase/isomerase family protein n=1 Tax=Pseudopelagicola sp. nBUS_19 TaxID=3395316 RepID=UPI003EBE7C02